MAFSCMSDLICESDCCESAVHAKDTPFSGGLGSYKLYVLVVTHITRHVGLGGRDDPGEIFMSFAYRYGTAVASNNCHRGARTAIEKGDIATCRHGGKADLSNVFLINECRSLFGSIWNRLHVLLRLPGGKGDSRKGPPRTSYLAEVIHTTWLDHSRETSNRDAELFLKEREQQNVGRRYPAKQTADSTVMPSPRQQRDLTKDELVASYNGRATKRARRSS